MLPNTANPVWTTFPIFTGGRTYLQFGLSFQPKRDRLVPRYQMAMLYMIKTTATLPVGASRNGDFSTCKAAERQNRRPTDPTRRNITWVENDYSLQGLQRLPHHSAVILLATKATTVKFNPRST